MSLIALASVKASPGATTTALALGVTWPAGPRPVVIECDPAGGDLAARWSLPEAPGLVSLAAACRHESAANTLWRHTQRLPGGLEVIAGPVAAEQAHAALGLLGTREAMLRDLATRREIVAVADCGRVDPASRVLPVLRAATATLLVVRPQLGELSHARARLAGLRATTSAVGVILVGGGVYPPSEVAAALGVPVIGELPGDRHGAAALRGQAGGRPWQLTRLPLLRSARVIANRLAQLAKASATGGDQQGAADVLARLDGVTMPPAPAVIA